MGVGGRKSAAKLASPPLTSGVCKFKCHCGSKQISESGREWQSVANAVKEEYGFLTLATGVAAAAPPTTTTKTAGVATAQV